MSDPGARLLQMLEPAVRPGQASQREAPAQRRVEVPPPFEGRTFDDLLRAVEAEPPRHAASSPEASGPTTPPTTAPTASSAAPPPDPLGPLRSVENASLSRLLARRSAPDAPAPAPAHDATDQRAA